jgi:hypothetical protein
VFGAARPREEVLREQGRDAVKEDQALEHEAVDRWELGQQGQAAVLHQPGLLRRLLVC